MKKIVVLTGAGMSVESGLKTFRDADGLWENYPVQKVATHEGWLADPTLVTNFYNMLRKKCWGVQPNEGHKLVAKLEEQYDVTVVTECRQPPRDGGFLEGDPPPRRTDEGLFQSGCGRSPLPADTDA